MLGALAGIAGVIANMFAANQANQTNLANLAYQKQRDREMTRQSEATRIDAYGNTTKYNPDTNTWEVVLTPQQRAITEAMQRQQLLSQTEDATRARALRQRQEVRSVGADKLYNKALLDYQYGNQPYSEGAYQNVAQGDIVRATDEQRAGPRADIARMALRTGQGQNLNSLLQGIDSGSGSPGLAASILAGKEKGGKDYQTAMAGKYAKLAGPVSAFEKIADDIGGYSDLQSNVNQTTGATESEMARAIQAALGAGADNVESAYQSLASGLGKGIDFAGITQALMGLDKQNQGGTLTAGISEPSGGATGLMTLPTPRPDTGSSVKERTGSGSGLSGLDSPIDWGNLGNYYDYSRMKYNF